ncbi:MAG: RICIN domain-containing protein [Oscillospiraceae bacterium]|nr:RICIN domain-containing protein [Oscillospiraceae bacterium]
MRNRITRVVTLVLCLAMLACLLPQFEVPAFAAAEYPNTHVNTGNMAADIVAVAVSQAGYCEGSLSGNPAYAGSNNYQKYGQWYDANVDNIGVTYAAWCAAFVSWCANQAGIPSDIMYYHAYCPYGVNFFKNQGRFQYAASRGGSYIPNPGDIIYFAPAGSSTSSHVGIVRYVADGYVYTVEGNTSGQNGEVNEGGGVFLKSYSLSYSRIYGYGTPAYTDNSGHNPIGQIDSVTAVGPGKIRVCGWTMDEDALWTPLTVHIYVGGGPGDPNAEGHIITADQLREDVGQAYPFAGNYHGFDTVISTGKSGWTVVNVFGMNQGNGDNTLLTNSGWIVDVPKDTEAPVISEVEVSNVTSTGYTVTCTVTDNVGISKVLMPTWTEASGQDDIMWGDATTFIIKASFNVSFSSHNFEYGQYNTHIYAYDLAGNHICYPIVVDVPPVLPSTPVSGTVGEDTYFIASSMNKNFVLDVDGISTENHANVQLYYTLGTSPNQMWKISDPDGDGYYTIIAQHSGKALDAAGGGTTDGTNVQQYDINGSDAQLWQLVDNGDGTYRILNKLSGLALDLKDAVLTLGQNIQLYTSNGTPAQSWYLIPADTEGPEISDVQFTEVSNAGFRVTCTLNDVSGIQKVDFPAWTSANGADDQIWHAGSIIGNTATCYIPITEHNSEPGHYELHIYATDTVGNTSGLSTLGVDVPNRIGNSPISGTVAGGTYFIANCQNQNFVADVDGVSAENGANIHLWETLGVNKNQMWEISDPDGDGYYTIVSLYSGKAMEAAAAGTTDGTNVQQYDLNGTDAQLWQLIPNDDGTYYIVNKNSSLVLDLFFGVVANGQNLQTQSINFSPAQRWYLIPAELTGPEISNVQFTEVTSDGFRITCTVSDPSGIQKVEFPAWTGYNGQDDTAWYEATVTGNTATCYIPVSNHGYEPGYYDVHIYAYDGYGNRSGVVTSGVTVPNRIGMEAVDGKLENGTYFIATAQNQNFVVDVEAVSTENGANIQLWETFGTSANQMWQIVDADGDGYYTAAALHSGKYLDVDGGVSASDTNVQQYEATYSDAQLWQIVPNEDGTYCLYSKCGGFALDLYYGQVSNGVNIRIHDVNGAVAQKWYLIPAKLSADTAHVHTYLDSAITEPTCTEPAYISYTCANCAEVFVEHGDPATGHSYNYSNNGADHTVTCANCDYNVTEKHTYENGACLCGATEAQEPAEVSIKISHSVSFDSDLQMNYRIKYENIAAVIPSYVSESAYLVVEKDRYPEGGGEKTVETVTLYPDLTGDPERMRFSLPGIQSVEMGSELRAVLHLFDAEGNEYLTPVDAYSVLDYARLCYDSYTYDQQPKLYTMLIDALNYGAAAQLYFGRRVSEPVNAGMEAYQQYATTQLSAELNAEKVTLETDRSITAVSKIGFSVTFADKTEMNAKLTLAEGYSKEDITCVKVLDAEGNVLETLTDFAELSDGRLQATYYGVKSIQMREMFYFVAYVGDQIAGDTVGYSVEAYARSNVNSSNASLADMVLKCMYYGDSAAACFGS